jgi:tetratricopeptide (TPR) repeat protein
MQHNGQFKIGLQVLAGMATMVVLLVLLYQLPPVQDRLGWRIDAIMTGLRMDLNPLGSMPTPVFAQAVDLETSTPTPTATVTSTQRPTTPGAAETETPTASPTVTDPPEPTLTPTPLPAQAKLDTPLHETQDWNNCGPATLAMYLRFYGWKGTQYDISKVVKVFRNDRNVNIDELTGFVHDNATELSALYRVGGSIDLIRSFLANGVPVMIEEASKLDQDYWTKDDRWAGHYLFINGYDDATQTFLTQDTYYGANRHPAYTTLDKNWQAFNRAFILVYTPDQEGLIESLLGDHFDMDTNRQHALDTAQAETEKDPQNAFAWFNLGTNLAYFERYDESAKAYDKAREIGLPQRMMRYQFGIFMAYFHTNRNDDLLALTDYALKVTTNSEEALLWRGWALYRAGKRDEALAAFNQALQARPDYSDALYAVKYVTSN